MLKPQAHLEVKILKMKNITCWQGLEKLDLPYTVGVH